MNSFPGDQDAERALLGNMIVAPASVREVVRTRAAEDFAEPAHRVLFAAIVAVHRGGRLDVVELVEYLRAAGQLDEIGGISCLTKIVFSVP